MRLKTVLHPRFARVKAIDMPPADRLTLADYVAVPAIATHGSWSMLDLLTLDAKASLFGLHKFLEKGSRKPANV